MAYQIIKHRIMEPTAFAVHFTCSCGCEFWADQNSVKKYCTRKELNLPEFLYYETKCPECDDIVYSVEADVPKYEVFTD